ncbi:MAG: hypothetical protein ACRC8S_22440 [Fimbriiglobus sp.]
MQDLNVLALFKGEERFIFVFDDESRDEVIASIRNCAADSDTAFNWFDAAVLTERAKQKPLGVSATDGTDDRDLI